MRPIGRTKQRISRSIKSQRIRGGAIELSSHAIGATVGTRISVSGDIEVVLLPVGEPLDGIGVDPGVEVRAEVAIF
jgi:hypothetical protein